MNKKNNGPVPEMMAAWRQSGGALEALPADSMGLRSRRRQETADEGLSASMNSHAFPYCVEPDEGLSASMGSRNYPWCVEPDEGLAASSLTHPAVTCWSHPAEGLTAASHTANRVCIPGPAASSYSVRSLQNCIGETDEGLSASMRSIESMMCDEWVRDEGLSASMGSREIMCSWATA